MTYVSGIGANAGTTPTDTGAAASAANTGLNQLDNSQTFLNLLVAQLKNQNPDNPSDPTAFMTEIAQLTSVQSQTNLATQEQTVAADSMLGRSITANTSSGQVTGVVTSVVLPSTGGPQLVLQGQTGTIQMDQISQVYNAIPSSTSTPSTAA